VRPSDPDEVYLSTGEGFRRSHNGGEAWELITDNTFRIGYPDQMVLSPEDDHTLYMAGSSHDPSFWLTSHQALSTIVRSRDGGRTWEPAANGLPDPMRPSIEGMSVASYPGGFELYVADTDGNVYCSEDGAEHWTLIASGVGAVSKGGHAWCLN
jgi:hypothetical protein